jgi:hypothetical protein
MWRVLAGSSPSTLVPLQNSPKHGFETAISAPTGMGVFEVQALDSRGNVLSTSPTTTVPPHIGITGRTAFVSRSGTGGLPAVCDNGFTCHIVVTITAGRTVMARTGSEQIPANGGGVIYFSLTRAGRSKLAHARGRRLLVRLIGTSGKLTLNRLITLVPFSTSGAAPARNDRQSSTLQLVGLTDFVSANGVGGILAECVASTPCHTSTTVSAGGRVIATTGTELLGARDLGYLIFPLNSAGKSMLARARGNQLGAQVRISDGGASASGSISLVRFR